MTPDAWPRLGLVVACTAYAVGLVVVWQQLGWVAAVAGLVGGGVLALTLSIETSQPAPVVPEPATLTTNQLDDELRRRARRGDVPVATRKGRPLASVDGDDAS